MGNILSQKRNGGGTSATALDELTYNYHTTTDGLVSNRLYQVNDVVSAGNYTDDIDDQGTFNNTHSTIETANNYGYDELGNLVRDAQEEIASIEWTVYGKMKKITRNSSSSKADLEFGYDASGNRLWKKVTPKGSGAVISTYYYLRDAQGNEMCRYVKYTNTSIQLMYVAQEHSIYGSSRVGVDNRKDTLYKAGSYSPSWGGVGTSRRELGLKSFELANHLGNVLVTVSDKPIYKVSSGTIYFQPEITSTSDYYPFGAPIAGRSAAFGNEYRFGFNGKEGDDEVNGEGNRQDYGMRMYDGRLGRAFSVDPLTGKFPELSPFQFFSNSPIANMDLDGLEAWPVTRQWNPPDIDGFAVYSMAAIKQMKSDKIKDDCANFALRLIVGYASQNGLPLTLTNTANRTFDASSTKYSTPTQYLNDVRVNIQAKDLVRNTYGVDQADQQPGDLEIMHYTLHNSKKVNFDHVVIISNNIGSIVYGNLYPDGSGEILAGPFNNWTHDTRTNDGVKNKWTMYHGKMSSRWNVLNPATMTPVVTNTPAITDTTTTPQSP